MNRLSSRVLMALLTINQVAQAQLIDLPDPTLDNTPPPSAETRPAVPVVTAPQVESQTLDYRGSVDIKAIPRAAGGTALTVNLQKAALIKTLVINVKKGRVKIIEAKAKTVVGHEIDLKEFRGDVLRSAGDVLEAHGLDLGHDLVAVKIRAESFGSEADVQLVAVSENSVPKLVLENRQVRVEAPAKPAPKVVSTKDVQVSSGPFRVNERLVYYSGSTYYDVRILALYPNGQAKLQFSDGSEAVRSVSNLMRPVSSYNGYRVNESVVYYSGSTYYNVRILALYPDGMARLQFSDGSEAVRSASNLMRPVSSYNGYRVNESVVYYSGSTYYNVRILALYPDGMARLQFSDGSEAVRSASNLMRPVSNYNGYRVNESVVYYSGSTYYNVRILTLYPDGRVRLQFSDGSEAIRSVSNLMRPLNSYNGYRVNEVVVYYSGSSYYDVRILTLYPDGRVRLQFSDGSEAIRSVSNLMKGRIRR